MNATSSVLDAGVVYVDGNTIRDVRPASATPPAGFVGQPRVNTNGTIYPGLIELHNHLSYNVLPLWNVPKKYEHRGQWANVEAKRKLISGPMELLTDKSGYAEAVVRYVECKCLVAGVTSTQGLTLSSAPGIQSKYRGVVRNVEVSNGPAFPAARPRIADVEDATAFLKTLRRKTSSYVLHLSEGIPPPGSDAARKHFLNLKLPNDTWAITPELVGIHSAGLTAADFATLGANGGAMVWSPLSNLLLYGETANVQAAVQAGVRISFGSDWSPSGSKNLLGELKVARIYSGLHGNVFDDEKLARMATIEAARILKWDSAVGSIEANKRADLMVVDSQQGGAYLPLLTAGEGAISLVVIDGVPRYGLSGFMATLGSADGEALTLAGRQRRLKLDDATTDPVVGGLTLAAARDRLKLGLSSLPNPPAVVAPAPIGAAADGARRPRIRLVLDNDSREGLSLRPLAPLTTAEVIAAYWAASIPLKDLVKPLELDELTVEEDKPKYFARLQAQMNLPADYRNGLPGLYEL